MQKAKAPKQGGREKTNPYVHFIVSEFWAALTSVSVYLLFRLAGKATDTISEYLPVHDPAPAEFLSTVIHWGAAVGGSMTFAIVTIYQIVILAKTLWIEAKT